MVKNYRYFSKNTTVPQEIPQPCTIMHQLLEFCTLMRVVSTVHARGQEPVVGTMY